ncbi:FAD-dependent monooxygenase [Streptomyces sp. AD2-2]|nr:FAD-dependent monooxygenase [Streptomyces sp. AD2-2]
MQDITTGAERPVVAAAVLGCDGATSPTRQAIGSRHFLLCRPQHWFVVDVRCPVPLSAWEGVHQVCDPARPATYMRVGEDRYRWEFRLSEQDAEQATTDRSRLLRLLSPWTGSIPEEQLEVVRLARYTFRAQVADSWRQDRVFLLGDAAHLTPPFIGQGLGAGLRDAHNLTWKLARVLTGQSSESLLDTYESERRPHAIHLVRTAVRVGRAMTSAHPVARVSRRVGLAVGRHTGLLTQAALTTLSPALRGGALTGGGHNLARLPGRGPRPGELSPQPPMRTLDNLPVRLDDLLGDGFALLTCRTPTPTERRLAQALAARIVTVLPPAANPAAFGPRARPSPSTQPEPSPRGCATARPCSAPTGWCWPRITAPTTLSRSRRTRGQRTWLPQSHRLSTTKLGALDRAGDWSLSADLSELDRHIGH